MKKRFAAAFMAAILIMVLLCANAFAAGVCFVDGAKLVSSTESVNAIKERMAELRDQYQLDIAIVTTNSIGGRTEYDYCEKLYQQYGLGVGEARNGVLLMINMANGSRDDRTYYVYGYGRVGNRVERSISDSAFTTALSSGRYVAAFDAFLDEVERTVKIIPASYYEGKGSVYAMDRVKEMLPLVLGAGAVIALIVVLVLRGKMKTAKGKKNATDYIVADSFRLDRAVDLYLYSTYTRTKIESNSGSHGGGGGGGSHGSGHGGHF